MESGRKGLSIFYRLLVAFLAVVVVISGILATAVYYFNRTSLERQTREQTIGQLSAIEQSFRHHFQEDLVKSLNLLSSNPKLNEFMMASGMERDIVRHSVERIFMKVLATDASFRHVTFVDAMGNEVIKVGREGPAQTLRNVGRTRLFRQIATVAPDRVIHEVPSVEGSGYPSFSIGIHKSDEDIGQFGGAVMIDVELEPFFRYLEGIRIFDENVVWIFGPDGTLLGSPRNRAATFDPSPYLKKGYGESPEIRTVGEGILVSQDLSLVPGKPFLKVALSVPSSLLLKDTRITTKFILAVSALSILLAFAISLYLSRYLSGPIIELAAASGRLAEGDLSTKVRLRTTGEVQELVDGFNKMAEDLKATTVSKDYMDNIIHSLADSLVVLDPDMTIRTVNQALLDLLGYGEAELPGNPYETVDPEGAAKGEEFRSGGIRNREMTYRAKDGRLVPVLVTGSVIFSKKGEILGYVIISKDIAERKRAEEALREANDRLNATLQASPAAIMTLNPAGMVTMWNEAAERVFGWTREETIGCFNPLSSADGPDDFQALRERVQNGGSFYDLQVRRRRKDGSAVDISLSSAPLHDAQGNVVGVVAVMNDITGRKKMESELAKVQKLESIGILAGGIAHDFNNILTIVLGYISLAKHSVKSGEIARILLEAEKASLRAKDLTHQLLTFSRGGSPVKRAISISETIRESANFALRGSNVRCEFGMKEPLWSVEADEGQIGQVIQNLVINANQAMPGGGTIRIVARNFAHDGGTEIPLPAGRYVMVAIEDRGTGIPKENLQKIFDPYFTTKEKGSGLGLAIVYSIVRNHGGHIKVESTRGSGTTVTFYLPGSDHAHSSVGYPGEEVVYGNGRVLLMDDEAMVREAVGEMLVAMGYEVEFAKDGAEAIDLYLKAKEAEKSFSAVIMDLTIPGGMGGREAIRKLRQIDSGVIVIVSSGYSDDPVMANFREYGFNAVIAKPFRLSELSKTLRQGV